VRFGGRDNASGGPHDRVAILLQLKGLPGQYLFQYLDEKGEARRITSLVSLASQLDEEKKKKSRDYRLMF